MRSPWTQFLADAGARYEGNRLCDFGDAEYEARAALEGDVITDLSHVALIGVKGKDAGEFLARQFTNDVTAIGQERTGLGAWCTPKGRVIVLFRLFRWGHSYYLLTPADSLQTTLHRLQKYVLRSDVHLNDASDKLVRIGLSGPNTPELLAKGSREIPKEPDAVSQTPDLVIMRIVGPHPRFLLTGAREAIQDCWRTVQRHATAVGPDNWALLDILSGLPMVTHEISEEFLPQMLNLHRLGGLSFTKGCYPGQEVIARLKYRGQLKRRMYLALSDTNDIPGPGTKLYAGSASGPSVGQVVSAARYPDGTTALLAVIEIRAATGAAIVLDAPGKPSLRIQDLPYSPDDG